MKRLAPPIEAVSAAILLASLACTLAPARTPVPDVPFVERRLSFDGAQRRYDLWVPDSLDSTRPAPLVLVLHGGGGNPEQVCRMRGGIPALADAEGFIVACPAGVDGHWNDGRAIETYRAQRENVDDVGFLKAVVDDVAAAAPVDRKRVYVTGLSNGGMMTLRLACEAGDTFAAFGAVIANLPSGLDCHPAQPVPVLLMNGTDDPLMPWNGGQVHFLRRQLGPVLSAEATFALFAAADGCEGDPHTIAEPDSDPSDGTTVEQHVATGCVDGAAVELIAVQGGGHTLPGGDQYAPAFLVGRVSRDLDGAGAIWDFLSRFSNPQL